MNSRMMISSVPGSSICSRLEKTLGRIIKNSVSPHKNTLS